MQPRFRRDDSPARARRTPPGRGASLPAVRRCSFVPVVLLAAAACRSGGEREKPAPAAPPALAPAVLHDAVDRATRDRFRQPGRVITALGLRPGQRTWAPAPAT
jgi:hypothetical protein